MKAFVFPGQGAQFVGMGKDLYEKHPYAKELFEKANDILGFRITDIMFSGTDEELKQTKVTQPAVFLHSVISALLLGFRGWSEAGSCPCHCHAKSLRGSTGHYGRHHRPAGRNS